MVQRGAKNTDVDLVAGRLNGLGGGEASGARPGNVGRSSYGASRLGISAGAPPQEDRSPLNAAPAMEAARAAREREDARAAEPPSQYDPPHVDGEGEAVPDVSWRAASLRLLGRLGGRRARMLAAAGAILACLAGWAVWHGASGRGSPQAAMAQSAAPAELANAHALPKAPATAQEATKVPTAPRGADDPTAAVEPAPGGAEGADLAAALQKVAQAQQGEIVKMTMARAEAMPVPPAVAEARVPVPSQAAASQPAAAASQPVASAATPQTMPATRLSVCPSGFALVGIMSTARGRMANINDEFVAAGQSVGGATVVAIHDTWVEMEMEGERFAVGQYSLQDKPK